MNGLNEKTIIVTGGASGIGGAACRKLAEEGATVAITDVQDAAGEKLADEINETGGTARYWNLDVTEESRIKEVFAEVNETFGSIDGLVNNAGISGVDKPTHQVSKKEWDQVMKINVDGVFLCTKYVIPYMKENGSGNIINMSSIYGIIGNKDLPPYHASKGAVRLMTKNDALTYAKDNIRINSVHPGFIDTPLVDELAERKGISAEEFRSQLDSLHPMGHIGKPEDIANGIAFLASEEAGFMTGSELVIDGGYTAQ
jgi:NAD(P)-dependent dehydrogenase (short-subunit alcohol dehydrogenase family)